MTRCRSTTRRQLGQRQSFQRHALLWPFRQDTTPWFRHLAHFGVRSTLPARRGRQDVAPVDVVIAVTVVVVDPLSGTREPGDTLGS